jgi:hypothetical protein
MPMRVIAKKRCRAMFEPPEKGERATLNPNLSTRLNLLFSDQALGRRGGYCWSRGASVQQDQVRDPSPTSSIRGRGRLASHAPPLISYPLAGPLIEPSAGGAVVTYFRRPQQTTLARAAGPPKKTKEALVAFLLFGAAGASLP